LSAEQFQSALARQCIVRTGEDLACRSPVSRNGAPVERVAGLASELAAGLAAGLAVELAAELAVEPAVELAVELAVGIVAELAEQLVVVAVHAAPVRVSMLIVSRVLLIEQP
jgi:hypothetical protein